LIDFFLLAGALESQMSSNLALMYLRLNFADFCY